MKKILIFAFILSLAAISLVGCATSTSTTTTTTLPTKTLDNSTASIYSTLGVDVASGISGSMGDWAEGGSVTGMSAMGVKASSTNALMAISAEADGWYHVTETISTSGVTIEIDVHAKLVSSEGVVTDVYIYGTYDVSYNYAGSIFAFTENIGSASSPFHGTATWNADKTDVTKIGISGSISLNATVPTTTEGTHNLAMTMTFTSYELPVTDGVPDYPTGRIDIAVTYDGAAQPNMAIVFDGDSTATFSYGDYTTIITIGYA
jgi:hypothetical protein